MTWRTSGPMDMRTAAVMLLLAAFCYSAWLTSIVFCAGNGMRPLLVAGAAFFPVGVVHGSGYGSEAGEAWATPLRLLHRSHGFVMPRRRSGS